MICAQLFRHWHQLIRLCIFTVLLVFPWHAQAQLKDITTPSSLWQTTRDGSGRIWGIASYQSKALYSWQSDHWHQTDFSPAGKLIPVLLTRRPNGVVVCLWRSEGPSEPRNEQPSAPAAVQIGARSEKGTGPGAQAAKVSENYKDYKVSEHQGQSSRFVAAFAAELEETPVLIATKKDLWITDSGRKIYRVEGNRSLKVVYALEKNQLFRAGEPGDGEDETNPLRAVTDGKGRLWFFSDVWSHGKEAAMLRGVLIWDGKRFAHHSTLFDTLPWGGFSSEPKLSSQIKRAPPITQSAKSFKSPAIVNTLALKDASHLWLALGNKGLYELDIRTLKARHIAEPRPKALEYIQQITAIGQDWYIVAGSRWSDADHSDGSVSTGDLWRLR